jgi:hypothetical protein
MPVEVRQAGDHWSVEVHGASIGVADTQSEARALAEYWQSRLHSLARTRTRPQAHGLLSRLKYFLNSLS